MRFRTLPLALLLAAIVTLVAAPGAGASNDPGFPRQWNLTQIGAPGAWARSTGVGVRIGIVDTGVDPGHEDLAGKVVDSTACINTSGDPSACSGSVQDVDGHGTHVSGIAAAIKDNGKGIAGVAPGAQLVVARVFPDSSGANIDDVNAGIHWVVDHGARVVNLSLGDSTPILPGLLGGSSSLSDGVNYAWNHGAVAVLASGNTNYFGLGSANYGNADALVVGATGPTGAVSSYSSSLGNAKWGLVAPGGDDTADNCTPSGGGGACVLSTWPGNQYALAQGTSMATPHVTAAVALLVAQGMSVPAAVQRILDTADKISCGTNCHGRLDVSAAVGLAPVANPGGAVPSGSGSPAPGATGTPRGSTRLPAATTTRPPVSGSTLPPASTTTAPAGPAAVGTTPGSGPPLVALPAARPPASTSGKSSDEPGRALAVAGAIVLLGGAGTGVALGLRWLRGAAAP